MIDGQVFLVFTRLCGPVGNSAGYLSPTGAAAQCVPAGGQPYKHFDDYAHARPVDGAFPIDLSQLSNTYPALQAAVNHRARGAGFNACGFYPPVALRDRWLSVRGKPSETVMAAWKRRRT